ncbi:MULTISPECIES: cytochrome P450 [Streptomyces]|uniref:cytochrome P450 n=1 Tax=Streptomyces TaxID=1883 RepID=UPI001D13923A|nr:MULTISPECIES: cytochrome P450 [Streptomyces]MCC3653765.1 cytochrome P450 [Streptomyces sp. S07_1.15]WSQ71708.1 cytochrome P450 [Streptomyces xinghaiensis]
MTQAATELPDFPWHRGCPMAAPKEYAEIRSSEPIKKVRLATGRVAWVVTRHEHVKALLTDPRASSDRAHEGFPYYIDVPQQFRTEGSFIGWDPPKHTLHRRMAALSGDFTKQRVRHMRPRMQEIVDECIDRMLETGPPVDLVHMLALRVPMTIVCEILGIPAEDQDYLHSCTDILFGGRSTAEERSAAIVRVGKYLEELVARKEEHPEEDLVSRMIARYRTQGNYDRREMCNVTRLLLNGGHETSAAMIALSVMSLLENPEQLAAYRSDPELAPKAIEELLRYLSPGDLATSRVALADIEIGDVVIREGEGMILLGMSANRDPDVFDRPDELDLSRGDRTHLAFGHGVHHCIGAEIARVELDVVLSTLFRRIPELRLAKPWQELSYKDGNVMYGVYEMPVTW